MPNSAEDTLRDATMLAIARADLELNTTARPLPLEDLMLFKPLTEKYYKLADAALGEIKQSKDSLSDDGKDLVEMAERMKYLLGKFDIPNEHEWESMADGIRIIGESLHTQQAQDEARCRCSPIRAGTVREDGRHTICGKVLVETA